MSKVAYVFPGQGSQEIGMGLDLYEKFSSARAVFDKADKVLGFPLSKLLFEGPEDELKLTVNAQPALVTMSIACLEAAKEAAPDKLPPAFFAAGHSLGEYSALAAAEVFDFKTAVYFAGERGRLMYEAGQARPGSMAAIIGLSVEALADICKDAGTYIANYNCPGQLVISGEAEKVKQASALAKTSGAKLAVPLQVSGAFHSPLMEPAVEGLSKVIDLKTIHTPAIPVIGNTKAQVLDCAEAVKSELLEQLCHSVQWQQTIEYLIGQGVDTFIEFGPGEVLKGLIKRINRNVTTINIRNAQDIRNLR